MKNVIETPTEQQFLEMENKFLTDINTALDGKIVPISKLTDLNAEQWFDIANLLLRHDVRLSHYARQIGIDMAQKIMPLAAYMR